MTVTAQQVKELREATNISMMECKRALVESDGDFDGALKVLKERGLAVANKRAGKDANEGAIVGLTTEKGSFMLALACETDFVANSDDFQGMAKELIEGYSSKGESYLKEDSTQTLINETVAKCGEKIVVGNDHNLENSSDVLTSSYVHGNKKIGVLIELSTDVKTDAIQGFAKDLAMQVAAMNPIALSQKEVNQEMRDEQITKFTKELEEEGKPAEMIEKIVVGKVNKYFADYCLEDMAFIKDGKTKIKDLIKTIQKESGASKLEILSYKRFQIGN